MTLGQVIRQAEWAVSWRTLRRAPIDCFHETRAMLKRMWPREPGRGQL